MCLIYPYLFQHWPRKYQFIFGFLGFAFSSLLLGPSQLFNFPNDYLVIILGEIIIGLFEIFYLLPIIPEIIERMQIELNIGIQDEIHFAKLCDKVNDIYAFVYAISIAFSPIIGR